MGVVVDLLVPIPRRVPEGHLVSGPDLLAPQLRVLGGRTPEVVDRAGVPQDLVHGDLVHLGPLGERTPLVGMVEEAHQAEADGVASRLVAGHQQQGEEEVPFDVGQLGCRAVVQRHSGRREDRPEVILWLGALAVGQAVGVHSHLDHGFLVGRTVIFLGTLVHVFRIASADSSVAPVQEQVPFIVRYPDDVGDGHQGEFGGHVQHKVGRPPLADPVQDDGRAEPHDVLHASDHARREPGVDQLAVPRVLGRVGHDHLEARAAAGRDVVQGYPAGTVPSRPGLVGEQGP